MEFLPIFLRLKGRAALVVGGGEVAARKVALLRRAGAAVTVLAPDLAPELAALAAEGTIRHEPARFEAGCFEDPPFDDIVLVIAATDDPAVNAAVAAAAERRRLPVNVVDDPAHCSFVMPAIVDRGPIVVAVSSGGVSPVLARLVRARIDWALPEGIGRLAGLAAAWRERVKAVLPDGPARRRFWESLLMGSTATRLARASSATADACLADLLAEAADGGARGWGGGRGWLIRIDLAADDPDRLTLGTLRRMQEAEIILHDTRIDATILDYARRDATLIAVADLAAGSEPLALALRRAEAPDRRVLILSLGAAAS
ncbi:MAG TPA: NAD(P)-dependent oxidoreductase [Stellaceae bacterium]|nr:NAD(P)-dependent oxidoreductase [Stellaceae bacterium]